MCIGGRCELARSGKQLRKLLVKSTSKSFLRYVFSKFSTGIPHYLLPCFRTSSDKLRWTKPGSILQHLLSLIHLASVCLTKRTGRFIPAGLSCMMFMCVQMLPKLSSSTTPKTATDQIRTKEFVWCAIWTTPITSPNIPEISKSCFGTHF